MKLYRLLTGLNDSAFCHKVTEALNKGWELHGSPCLTFNSQTGHMECGQAVYKEVPGKEYHPVLKLGDQ